MQTISFICTTGCAMIYPNTLATYNQAIGVPAANTGGSTDSSSRTAAEFWNTARDRN